jgi:hypothetical protein
MLHAGVSHHDSYLALLNEREPDLKASVQKAAAIESFLGQFIRTAQAVASLIVQDYLLPAPLKRVKALEEPNFFLESGLLFHLENGDEEVTRKTKADSLFPTPNPNRKATVQEPISKEERYLKRKMLGHELRACSAWRSAIAKADNSGGIKMATVLSCVVEQSGFRMQVTAIPPIDGDNTLALGFNEAGEGVDRQDEGLDKRLLQAGRLLNLKAHQIKVAEDQEEATMIVVSRDSQIHGCHDGRYYLTNLAHTFPPDAHLGAGLEFGDVGEQQASVQLLRPELLRAYKCALSADSFRSDLGQVEDQQQNDTDALEASRWLQNARLPEFVQQLDSLETQLSDSFSFTTMLHEQGINVRHIGRIAERTRLPHVREVVVVEMVARVAKAALRDEIQRIMSVAKRRVDQLSVSGSAKGKNNKAPRVLPSGLAHHFRNFAFQMQREIDQCVIAYFNLVLGRSAQSSDYWSAELLPAIKQKFQYHMEGAQVRQVHRAQLMFAIQHHCAVELADELYDFDAAQPFSAECLLDRAVATTCYPADVTKCTALADSAERFRRDGNIPLALQAYKLRLTLQSARGKSEEQSVGEDLREATCLAAMAEVCLELAKPEPEQATRYATAALQKAPGLHLVASLAHCCLLRAKFSELLIVEEANRSKSKKPDITAVAPPPPRKMTDISVVGPPRRRNETFAPPPGPPPARKETYALPPGLPPPGHHASHLSADHAPPLHPHIEDDDKSEQEQYEEALQHYELALEAATFHVGALHPLVAELKRALAGKTNRESHVACALPHANYVWNRLLTCCLPIPQTSTSSCT